MLEDSRFCRIELESALDSTGFYEALWMCALRGNQRPCPALTRVGLGEITLTESNDDASAEDWGDAEYWMARAEEAARAAGKLHAREARVILIEIAEKYRDMAERAAARASDKDKP